MNSNQYRHLARYGLLCLAVLGSACTTPSGPHPMESQIKSRAASLDARESALKAREASLKEAAAQAAAAPEAEAPAAAMSMGTDLLPPDAKSGECYARVWVEPVYRTLTEEVLVADASQTIKVIPPEYAMVEESVLVEEASSRLETIPATYETVSEQKLIQEASRTWRVDLGNGAPPASQDLLDAAAAGGINLSSASVGQCFHEHYRPATFEKVAERVLVAEGHEEIETAAAEYRWVEKQVLVRESSKRFEQYDAVYKTETEQVIDVPAHTIWKKGTGPIQRIDEATGEIMCLVDVPATYKTITKKVLVTPAGIREVEIPAEYKTVRVRELAREAQEHRHSVEPRYDDVYITKQTSDHSFVWHEVHDTTEPATTRTGKKICLTESPAKYTTVTRRVVKTPASTRTVEIPARYEMVKVKKLMADAREVRTEIPAVYKTVSRQELEKDGAMEWRSILCETNMTVGTISDIQRKLKAAGYNPGAIDGVIGAQTIDAVNSFQRDNDLPVDRYLNIETIKALNVAI